MSIYNSPVRVKNVNIPEINENLLYQKLMGSLKSSSTGGLSLALYHDKIIVKLIISYLKRDLPDHQIFALQMNSEEIDFPSLFKEIYNQTDKRNIFHFVGIETLSAESRSDFIACCNYAKEHFKASPPLIILWIPPQLEKELYFSEPNLYNWTAGVYDFSDISINYKPPEKKCLSVQKSHAPVQKQNKPSVLNKNISIYLQKVLWEYENWEEVKENNRQFLIREMENINLKSASVPLNCTDMDGKEVLADELFKEFLADNNLSFLTVMGDSEIENSSFTLYNFISAAKKYMQNKETSRIPLFISLKDCQGKPDIEDFIVREFREKYKIGISFAVFQRLALYGRFIIFIDGFDDILSPDKNEEESIEIFTEMFRLAFEDEASEKQNKVILSTSLYNPYIIKKNCKGVRINPAEEPEDIHETDTGEKISKILKKSCIAEKLSVPENLTEMISESMPVLADKKDVNLYDLYNAYTDVWIGSSQRLEPTATGRDHSDNQLTPQIKRRFLWQLANKMLKRKENTLHYTKISTPDLKNYSGAVSGKNELQDYYKEYSVSCSFLKRDENGNYSFVHPAFMSYFLAEYYFDLIKNQMEKLLSYSDLDRETKFFLKLIISSEKHNLKNLNLSCLDLENIDLTGADLTGANLQKARLNETDFTEADLTEADLTKANLRRTNFTSAKLIRAKLMLADFFEANLSNADFTEADLQRVILNEANLTGANLQKANLNDADMTNANFQRTNLTEASLRWTNLQKVNFNQANLSDANLLKAKLNKADFSEANLERANLNEADMAEASLNKANLKWAKMNKVNLKEADLKEADLREASLWKANLQNADLSGANLQKANLIKADIRWTNLNKTDLRGADLWQTNLNKANLADAIYGADDLQKAFIEGAGSRERGEHQRN